MVMRGYSCFGGVLSVTPVDPREGVRGIAGNHQPRWPGSAIGAVRTLAACVPSCTPRYWGAHLLMVVAVAATILLGIWQYHAWEAGRDADARDLSDAAAAAAGPR